MTEYDKTNSEPASCPMMNTGSLATQFEIIPAEEVAQIEEIARLTTQLQDKRTELPKQKGKVLRGVHPKSHGCLSAEFIINADIQKQYQVGLFAMPAKKYKAHIRFSNASVNIDADSRYVEGSGDSVSKWEHGSRGMAVKVYDVGGEVIDADVDGQKNQDFLMINTPEFAFSDVRSYLFLTRALLASEFGSDSTTLFALGKITLEVIMKARAATSMVPTQEDFEKLNGFINSPQNIAKFKIPQGFSLQDLKKVVASLLFIAGKIQTQAVRNPLQAQYFGASPFLFGEDRVMKFSVAPAHLSVPAEFATDPAESMDDDFLSAALETTINSESDIVYDFKILLKENEFGKNNRLIEDATTTWSNDGFSEVDQYQNVAKLVIKLPQKSLADDKCENLVFTPWHSLKEHQPIGSINRLRRSVYIHSAKHRRS